jgi:hypothetical protein
MNRSKFLPVSSSKTVFRNPTHCRELAKAAEAEAPDVPIEAAKIVGTL